MACALMVIQYVAHTFLFLSGKPSHGSEEIHLVDTMKSMHWSFGGFNRSYWDFYFGYGLIAIVLGAAEIATCFYMLIISRSGTNVRPLIALWIGVNVVHAVIMLNYFFLLPVIFDGLVSLALLGAFIRPSGRTEK